MASSHSGWLHISQEYFYRRHAHKVSEYDQEISQSQSEYQPWHWEVEPQITYSHKASGRQSTVNSEIFAKVLFSRNFAHAKFRENKIPKKGAKSLRSLLIWVNHAQISYFTSQICLLMEIVKMKFSQKFPNPQKCNMPILPHQDAWKTRKNA